MKKRSNIHKEKCTIFKSDIIKENYLLKQKLGERSNDRRFRFYIPKNINSGCQCLDNMFDEFPDSPINSEDKDINMNNEDKNKSFLIKEDNRKENDKNSYIVPSSKSKNDLIINSGDGFIKVSSLRKKSAELFNALSIIQENKHNFIKNEGNISLMDIDYFKHKINRNSKTNGYNIFPKQKHIKKVKKSLSQNQMLPPISNNSTSINKQLDNEYKKGKLKKYYDNKYAIMMINQIKDYYNEKRKKGTTSYISLKNNRYVKRFKE